MCSSLGSYGDRGTHLRGFPVVGLGLAVAAGVGPVTGVALHGGPNLGAGARPKPAVHVGGLQVGPVAACEVAFTPRRPDVPDIGAGYLLLHELVFL